MSVSSPLLVVTSCPDDGGAAGPRHARLAGDLHDTQPQAAVAQILVLHRVGIFTCTAVRSRMVARRTVTSRPLILSVTSGRGNGGVGVAVAPWGEIQCVDGFGGGGFQRGGWRTFSA